jgi:hypothetical protein
MLTAVGLVLLQSCGRVTIAPESLEAKLATKFNNCESPTTCTIRLREETNFEWDKFYVFKYKATRDEIRKALGFSLPRYQEFKRKLVFVNDGQLVYYEEEPTDIESLIDQEVVFDMPDEANFVSYGADAVFQVSKKRFQRGVYYQLELVR